MNRAGSVVVGLVCAWLAGCATGQPVRSTSLLSRLRQMGGPSGPDVVQMDVALLEQPVGDRYINQDFWSIADEQVVALERRAHLEDNGFRVGQLGGLPPTEFQTLLTSERSCANPRRIHLHAGKPWTVNLGPVLATCSFQFAEGGQSRPVNLEGAECALEVVPELTPDNRVRLRFTPLVQHGTSALLPCPAADRSGWVLQPQRPAERFPSLSWEVTLSANEFVVIGGRYDRPQTLGHESFVRSEGPTTKQRLLVIRTSRTAAPFPFDPDHAGEGETAAARPPTLAQQAAYSTVRGSRE